MRWPGLHCIQPLLHMFKMPEQACRQRLLVHEDIKGNGHQIGTAHIFWYKMLLQPLAKAAEANLASWQLSAL